MGRGAIGGVSQRCPIAAARLGVELQLMDEDEVLLLAVVLRPIGRLAIQELCTTRRGEDAR